MASYAKRISLTIKVEAETPEAAEQEVERVQAVISCVHLGNETSDFTTGEDYEVDLEDSDPLYRHDEENDRWVEIPEEQGVAHSGHENGP